MSHHAELKTLKLGDVFMVNLSGTENEQRGYRPCIIFQNNIGNLYSPNIVVIPLTSVIKKMRQPTHVFIPKEAGLNKDSVALCENPMVLSKNKLGRYVTTLPDKYIGEIAVGNLLASSAISYINQGVLISTWKRSFAFN